MAHLEKEFNTEDQSCKVLRELSIKEFAKKYPVMKETCDYALSVKSLTDKEISTIIRSTALSSKSDEKLIGLLHPVINNLFSFVISSAIQIMNIPLYNTNADQEKLWSKSNSKTAEEMVQDAICSLYVSVPKFTQTVAIRYGDNLLMKSLYLHVYNYIKPYILNTDAPKSDKATDIILEAVADNKDLLNEIFRYLSDKPCNANGMIPFDLIDMYFGLTKDKKSVSDISKIYKCDQCIIFTNIESIISDLADHLCSTIEVVYLPNRK